MIHSAVNNALFILIFMNYRRQYYSVSHRTLSVNKNTHLFPQLDLTCSETLWSHCLECLLTEQQALVSKRACQSHSWGCQIHTALCIRSLASLVFSSNVLRCNAVNYPNSVFFYCLIVEQS